MKRKDIVLIVIILSIIVIAFGFNYFINRKETDKIEVYVDNKLYKTYDITDTAEVKIETKEGYNIVKVHDGGVEVTEASCPDKICIKEGFIHKHSENIVCLPNKVNIKITGDNSEDNEEDVIAK